MTEFIGRLHPLIIHLPIGFIILLAVFEILALRPRFKHLSLAVPAILTLTVPVALLGALCGWLLSWNGEYDSSVLGWHKWLGVSFAASTMVLLFVHRAGFAGLYRCLLIGVTILMTAASHNGGSLTHGEGYLTAPLRKMFRKEREDVSVNPPTLQAQHLSVFATAIQPILKANCVSCHGEKKSKGKLRLETAEDLAQGGESGQVIVPNSAALSLLIKRIELPIDDEDHMPPEGKRQVTPDELKVLRWWIDAGADTEKTLAQLAPPEAVAQLIRAHSHH